MKYENIKINYLYKEYIKSEDETETATLIWFCNKLVHDRKEGKDMYLVFDSTKKIDSKDRGGIVYEDSIIGEDNIISELGHKDKFPEYFL